MWRSSQGESECDHRNSAGCHPLPVKHLRKPRIRSAAAIACFRRDAKGDPLGLLELDISNFAVISHLRLEFARGFTVITGETGAGKSVVLEALGLLLGGRAGAEVVRAGADRALVEGVFDVEGLALGSLSEGGIESEDGLLILSREIARAGRSVARVNGRPVPRRLLQAVGEELVDLHGQSEHLSLRRPARQLELVDRYAGTTGLRQETGAAVGRLRSLRGELEALRRSDREAARRADLLEYQVREIRAARLESGEKDALERERAIQGAAERITELAALALGRLAGDEERSAVDQLAHAVAALSTLEGLDRSAGELRELAETIRIQIDDLQRELRRYRESVEHDPARLSEVEDRLGVIAALERKYGDGVEEILSFCEHAEAELASLNEREEHAAKIEEAERALLGEIAERCGRLSRQRRDAASELAGAVRRELGALGMTEVRFEVELGVEPAAGGVVVPEIGGSREGLAFDATGVDRVRFVLSANPGEPVAPLAAVASGGEVARIMLGVKSALTRADPVPTLVFDEIDAGVGGRVGAAVGRALAELGKTHQVIAVTHLPQIAAYAESHVRLRKTVAGDRTVTVADPLSDDERLGELAVMLGSASEASRGRAAELLSEAGRKSGG
ncbi:MAG: DNA repair protein RecN [Actinomycetota bacterium]